MVFTKVVYPEVKMPTEEQKEQWRKEEDERLAGYIVYVVSEDLKRGGVIAEALKDFFKPKETVVEIKINPLDSEKIEALTKALESQKEAIVNTVVDNMNRNGAIARAVRGRAEEVIP